MWKDRAGCTEERTDYRHYDLNLQERIQCVLAAGVITGIVAWLFYRSCWGFVLFPVVIVGYTRFYRQEQIRKRKQRLLLEFKDAMRAVSGELLAGYSMENAWKGAEREILELHGEKSLMLEELRWMNTAVQMNEPLEKMVTMFAARTACDEIESFAEVLAFAKRAGGDFAKIIRTTAQKLSGRMEVEQEIATVLSGKRLEGNVMNLMPMFILAYMTLMAGDFLDVLYGNVLGVMIMSVVLIVYMAAWRMSVQILDITV